MDAGTAFGLVRESVSDMAFLNCRPSVIAAAIIYAERRARGIIPFWPSMLSKLTRYQDMSTPELSVAIKAAQRLVLRTPSSPRSLDQQQQAQAQQQPKQPQQQSQQPQHQHQHAPAGLQPQSSQQGQGRPGTSSPATPRPPSTP